MNPAPDFDPPVSTPAFRDGLGERLIAHDRASGEPLDMLMLRRELTAVPSFEFALRERSARLANFRHAYYGRVRRIDRSADPNAGLVIVSDHVEGPRLSEVLAVAEKHGLVLDINAALCLIRQLLPAVALLHENARDVAHGALAPERLIVTPQARLVIVEHVLGSALEQLQFARERLWKEFRIAMPPTAGQNRFDQRADIAQAGAVALALILGRSLRAEEFPNAMPDLVAHATETSVLGDRQPLSHMLRQWLARVLQLDLRASFQSAREAQLALEELLADESGYVAAPIALETFLARFHGAASEGPAPSVPPIVAAAPPVAVAVPATGMRPTAAAPASVAQAPRLAVSADMAAPAPVAAARPLQDVLDAEHEDDDREHAMVGPAEAGRSAVDIAPAVVERDDLFGPEMLQPQAPPAAPGPWWRRGDGWRPRAVRIALVLCALAALGEGAVLASRAYRRPAPPATQLGTLAVESRPAGAEIFIDGLARGVTPARLSLPPGAHILELRGRGVPRVIPFTIGAGAQLSQYLELPETLSTGSLEVRSEPSGARVLVDGQLRGAAPLTIADLAVGQHKVVVQNDAAAVEHTITIDPGATASFVAPLAVAPAGPSSGWVSFTSPVAMQVFEAGRLLGTTETDRIMVPAGRHQIDLVNETLGFRVTRTVQVPAGKTAPIAIELPKAPLSVNAVPWAEVWIDGQRVGETPLGTLQVALGPHEIVFRHPQLGEKRFATTVTLGSPARVSVDMQK